MWTIRWCACSSGTRQARNASEAWSLATSRILQSPLSSTILQVSPLTLFPTRKLTCMLFFRQAFFHKRLKVDWWCKIDPRERPPDHSRGKQDPSGREEAGDYRWGAGPSEGAKCPVYRDQCQGRYQHQATVLKPCTVFTRDGALEFSSTDRRR